MHYPEDHESITERDALNKHNIMTANAKIANAKQVGGSHYRGKVVQPWDYIVANNLGYLEGNIIKYVTRWKDKNGMQDLEKALHYLQKLIEVAGK